MRWTICHLLHRGCIDWSICQTMLLILSSKCHLPILLDVGKLLTWLNGPWIYHEYEGFYISLGEFQSSSLMQTDNLETTSIWRWELLSWDELWILQIDNHRHLAPIWWWCHKPHWFPRSWAITSDGGIGSTLCGWDWYMRQSWGLAPVYLATWIDIYLGMKIVWFWFG